MIKNSKPTREAVMESAIAAFGRKGYAGTSVNDILHATGLSKPTLYYYFDSKKALFGTIPESAYDGSAQCVQSKMQMVDECSQQTIEMAAGLFEFAGTHQNLMWLVFSPLFAAPGEITEQAVPLPKRRHIFDLAPKLIKDGQKTGVMSCHHREDEIAQDCLIGSSRPCRRCRW